MARTIKNKMGKNEIAENILGFDLEKSIFLPPPSKFPVAFNFKKKSQFDLLRLVRRRVA